MSHPLPLTEAEFRKKYEPLVEHFVKWRERLNAALGLDLLGSMEHAVAAVERAAHLSAGGWREIESAPLETLILIAHGKMVWIAIWELRYNSKIEKYETAWWIGPHGDDYVLGPTHWQPLPPPPSGEEQFYEDLRASGGIFPDTDHGEFHRLKNALIAIAKLPVGAETKDAREMAMTALNWYRLEDVATPSGEKQKEDDADGQLRAGSNPIDSPAVGSVDRMAGEQVECWELAKLIARARAIYEAMTPEQKYEHDKAQRESWVRGEMALAHATFLDEQRPRAGLIERLRRRRGILGVLEGDLDMMEEAADALDGMKTALAAAKKLNAELRSALENKKS